MGRKRKLTVLNKDACRYVRDEIRALGEQIGVVFELGRIQFDPDEGTGRCKLSFALKNNALSGRSGESPMRIDFRNHCAAHGLSPDDLDKEFVCDGSRWQIVGWRPRASKNKVIAKRLSSGKNYVFPPYEIKAFLAGTSVSQIPTLD